MKVVVVVSDAERERPLVDLAAGLASADELLVVSAIEVPEEETLSSAQPEARKRRRALDQLVRDVPNAQARDAWFTVDLRSNDAGLMADLDARILEACRWAAADVGVAFEAETIQRLKGGLIEGHRDGALVRAARETLELLEWKDVTITPRGTADHNIAILMGIPAVALGVTTGDGAHTPEEVADILPYVTGIKQLVILLAAPLS